MAHRRIAVVIFGVLVLAVPLAGPGVATPIATSTIAQPMEQAPATLAPCPAAEAGTILAQSDCCVRARGVCGCRGGRAAPPRPASQERRLRRRKRSEPSLDLFSVGTTAG